MSGDVVEVAPRHGGMNVMVDGFVAQETRIQVAAPGAGVRRYVVRVGGINLHADRADLTRLRDTLTAALDAHPDPDYSTGDPQ